MIISASVLLGRGTKVESSRATANSPKGPRAIKYAERRAKPLEIFDANIVKYKSLSIAVFGLVSH
jgi:hypothetical protein